MGKKLCPAVLAVLCLWLLVGCQIERKPTPTSQPTEAAKYTVTYVVRGETVHTETLAAGESPKDYTPEVNGLAFYGWLDEEGAAVTPANQPIESDRTYTAMVYPDLSGHRQYLYPDQYGCLRPDDVLTADDLLNALASLAEGEAMKYFPGLPAGPVGVSTEQLRSILSQMFPEGRLTALDTLTGETVTRGQFAVVMNNLLGRGRGELVVIPEGTTRPMDLSEERSDYLAMLEAGIPHTRDNDNGHAMARAVEELPMPEGLPTGFFLRGGWLYFADELGRIQSDTTIGLLTLYQRGCGAGRHGGGDPLRHHGQGTRPDPAGIPPPGLLVLPGQLYLPPPVRLYLRRDRLGDRGR